MKLHKNREKSLRRLQLERNITAYTEKEKKIYFVSALIQKVEEATRQVRIMALC